jgi:hypothetical protein
VADLARTGGWKKPSLLLNMYGNHVDDGSQDLAIERIEKWGSRTSTHLKRSARSEGRALVNSVRTFEP